MVKTSPDVHGFDYFTQHGLLGGYRYVCRCGWATECKERLFDAASAFNQHLNEMEEKRDEGLFGFQCGRGLIGTWF
jgi:hypothetical protein